MLCDVLIFDPLSFMLTSTFDIPCSIFIIHLLVVKISLLHAPGFLWIVFFDLLL